MKRLVVFGNGLFAEMLHFYFAHDTDYEIVAFTADRPYVKEGRFLGLPVVPFDEVERHFPPDENEACIALGYGAGANFVQALEVRKQKYAEALRKRYRCASYVSSKTIIAHPERIGRNCVVMEGSVLMPFATVRDNVILYPHSLLSHHVVLEDHSFVAGNTVIGGGGTQLGEGAFLGIGVTVGAAVRIGKSAFVGPGAVVTHDIEDGGVYTAANIAKRRPVKSSEIQF